MNFGVRSLELSSDNILEYEVRDLDTAQTDAAIQKAEALQTECGELYSVREVLSALREKHDL